MNLKKVIFIVGPTASGKTDVAVEVAEQLDGEIISCDAMQVYKEIHLASNKPSKDILRRVKHHLIDVVSVTEEFDVARFNLLATAAIEDILRRKKVPIVTGGSGMYMQILLDGIFEGAAKDEGIREALQARIKAKGLVVLYQELQKVDPKAAAKINANDQQRIIRALEIFQIRSQPISGLQPKRQGIWGKYDIQIFALSRERKELYARVEERVEEMFAKGIVKEVEKIQALPLSPTAKRIIGVPEVLGILRGEYPLDRAKYLMKLNTRHLAKRQVTWFKKEKRLEWIMLSSDVKVKDVVRNILEKVGYAK